MLGKAFNAVAPATTILETYDYKKKLIIIFCLSISSGLPFLLLLSTLSIWLMEAGISKTQIGLFAWATFPYTLKFLLAPLLESYKVPLLANWLGFRRSWLVCSQVALIISIVILGQSSPETGILFTAVSAFLVGIFAAMQDIMFEAYRIEILERHELGVGSSASVVGYRIGMLVSGAGAIYLASFFSWSFTYNVMAGCVGIGIITTLLAFEPSHPDIQRLHYHGKTKEFFNNYFFKPLKHFEYTDNLALIIAFLVFFKMADTVLNVMTMPFLLEIGFNKVQIANVAKTFGISTMIFGSIFAGYYLSHKKLYDLLLLCAILQLIASLLFVLQAYIGSDLTTLFVTMGVENITCGMSQVAIIAYLSRLCNLSYTATHYALLSSMASFLRVHFSSLSGFLADHLSWIEFYFMVALSCLPAILILIKFKGFFKNLHFVKT